MAARSTNAVKRFNTLMDELRTIVESGAGPATVLEAVLERTGYLAELQASTDPQDESRIENLQELAAVAREFEQEREAAAAEARDEPGTPVGTLAGFLEQVALVADSDQIPDEDDRRHGRHHADDPAHRQGPGVPGGLPDRHGGRRLPAHALAGQTKELEEERRLAYVGITRARQRLYLTRVHACAARGARPRTTRRRGSWRRSRPTHLEWKRTGAREPAVRRARRRRRPVGKATFGTRWRRSVPSRTKSGPSGFATRRAADKPVVALAVGDRVTHDQFGLGTVIGVKGTGADAQATIDFGDDKPKRLLLRYAPVREALGAAAARPSAAGRRSVQVPVASASVQ